MTDFSKIGRNAPCPCGSGKKCKKCCLEQHEASGAESAPTAPEPTAWPSGFTWVEDDEDDIDELSNSVLDLIDERRLDEAEERCQELRKRYPEAVDWMMRLAAVYEARKDWKRAADYYRRSADFAEENLGYGEESIDDFRDTARRLEEKAASEK